MANYYVCTIKNGSKIVKEKIFAHCSDDAARMAEKNGKLIDISRDEILESKTNAKNRRSKTLLPTSQSY